MLQQEEKLERAIARRPWLGVPLSLLTAVIALLLFAWLATSVLESRTQFFDLTVRAAIHKYASPALTTVMKGVTWLGSGQVLLPSVLCLLAIFLLRGMGREARLLIVTMAGAGVLDTVLKLSFHRARPAPFFGISPLDTYSFPSGHALVSFCFYGLLAELIALRQKRLRWLIWTLAGIIVALIGFSRIYLGVHYPSDVIAGYIAALFWMGAVRAVAERRKTAQ